MKKMPPIEKIYEAWTALVDGRVTVEEAEMAVATASDPSAPAVGRATVTSSDGSKSYAVAWDGDRYASSDNATYWQGYPGYPVLAVLMLQGRLPYDREVAQHFAGVAWKQINDAHKRDYQAALEDVFVQVGMDASTREACERVAQEVYDALAMLDLTMKRKL